jgi:anti-sigma factor RsiW
MLSRWLLICALVAGLVFGQSTMAAAMAVSATAASDHCSDSGPQQTDDQAPTKQMRCGSCAAVELAVPRPIARVTTTAEAPRLAGPAPLADVLPDHDTPPPRLTRIA